MFFSVMVIFAVYAFIFILFEDYDRKHNVPFEEASDWHLLIFSVIVMFGLAFLLHRYAGKMDKRISREQAEKENKMRRELTQNISHELKTPVASILGFTDTILENENLSDAQKRLFVERANSQAKRLTSLLHDISTLNRIDFAPQMIEMIKTDVSDIVAEIVSETSLTMSKKKMTMSNCLPSSIVVNGNFTLIYSIFRNLFDNSINYAGENTCIEIMAQESADMWNFTFADNGQGMDDKHLSRIFERFYRVDKGRSRKLGGTGLGLAIVKNAVMIHGGTIKAEKNHPHGIIFRFSLKK